MGEYAGRVLDIWGRREFDALEGCLIEQGLDQSRYTGGASLPSLSVSPKELIIVGQRCFSNAQLECVHRFLCAVVATQPSIGTPSVDLCFSGGVYDTMRVERYRELPGSDMAARFFRRYEGRLPTKGTRVLVDGQSRNLGEQARRLVELIHEGDYTGVTFCVPADHAIRMACVVLFALLEHLGWQPFNDEARTRRQPKRVTEEVLHARMFYARLPRFRFLPVGSWGQRSRLGATHRLEAFGPIQEVAPGQRTLGGELTERLRQTAWERPSGFACHSMSPRGLYDLLTWQRSNEITDL